MKSMLLFLGGIGMQEILLIGLVVLIFFGAKKIPEFMKGLGKGVKEFKEGIKEVKNDFDASASSATPQERPGEHLNANTQPRVKLEDQASA